jgi:hypothetical protein
VTNTGNVRLKPTAKVKLHGFNLPTSPISTSRIEDLLPGSTVTITGRLAKPPAFGTGQATATVDDGVGHQKAAVVPLSLIPVVPIAGIALGLLLAFVVLRRYVRFLRRARAALRLAASTGQPA